MRSLRGPCLVIALLVLPRIPCQAQDCHDLSGYSDCPPVPVLAGPQDCASCTPLLDDDNDGAIQEEILNYADDDGDTLVDEDISCLNSCDPMAYRGCPPDRIDATELIQFHPAETPIRIPGGVFRWGRTAGEIESLTGSLEIALSGQAPGEVDEGISPATRRALHRCRVDAVEVQWLIDQADLPDLRQPQPEVQICSRFGVDVHAAGIQLPPGPEPLTLEDVLVDQTRSRLFGLGLLLLYCTRRHVILRSAGSERPVRGPVLSALDYRVGWK